MQVGCDAPGRVRGTSRLQLELKTSNSWSSSVLQTFFFSSFCQFNLTSKTENEAPLLFWRSSSTEPSQCLIFRPCSSPFSLSYPEISIFVVPNLCNICAIVLQYFCNICQKIVQHLCNIFAIFLQTNHLPIIHYVSVLDSLLCRLCGQNVHRRVYSVAMYCCASMVAFTSVQISHPNIRLDIWSQYQVRYLITKSVHTSDILEIRDCCLVPRHLAAAFALPPTCIVICNVQCAMSNMHICNVQCAMMHISVGFNPVCHHFFLLCATPFLHNNLLWCITIPLAMRNIYVSLRFCVLRLRIKYDM